MSASPQPFASSGLPQPSIAVSSSPSGVAASSHPSSNSHPAASFASDSPAQLATLLANAIQEADAFKHELSVAKRRAEKAERILANLSSSSSGSPPTSNGADPQQHSPATVKIIMDYEARIERAERARDDTEARLLAVQDAWSQLDRYLASLEYRTHDARAVFTRLLDDKNAKPVFSTTFKGLLEAPLPFQLSPTSSRIPSSRLPNQVSSSSLSQVPLPPPPTISTSRVRRRSGSLDASVHAYAPPPPSKRPRSDRDRDIDMRNDYYSVSIIFPPYLCFVF